MSIKVTPDKYPEIIETYNTEGKTAAYDLMRSRYELKNPSCLMKKLKTNQQLGYNPEADRFEMARRSDEDIFMNLEELCEKRSELTEKTEARITKSDRLQAMENMVHTLISDRLLELSKYVLLDPVSKRILIDKNGMQADGYQVVIS